MGIILQGYFCNWLVCLAIWSAFRCTERFGQVDYDLVVPVRLYYDGDGTLCSEYDDIDDCEFTAAQSCGDFLVQDVWLEPRTCYPW